MNIDNEIKKARLARKELEVRVLGSLKSALTNKALYKGGVNVPLTEQEILEVVRKQVKQREDSIVAFTTRPELAANELAEKEILERFLPKALTEEELNGIILLAITETGATSKKDMGRAIKRAVELSEGRTDNKTISTLIGKALE